MLGCGGVAKCTLPLILKHLNIAPSQITVMDFVDNRKSIQSVLDLGVQYVQDRVLRDNLDAVLKKYVKSGDLLIDVAWNIDCCEILQWCHDHNVMYLNTSVELWDPYEGAADKAPTERTLYVRHVAIRKMMAGWKEKGATAVLEHGANPGLVSHFVKEALTEITQKILKEKPNDPRKSILEKALVDQNFPVLAQHTGVKTIHIAERDTQITNQPKQVNEFVNTWSVEGFYEEGVAPAEMGWGTHERRLPPGAQFHRHGPGNQICMAQMGVKTWVRSWVPTGTTTGMVVRHGESFTISDHLTVWQDGKPVYRPTVHYAYCPSDVAINSLHELEMRGFDLQKNQRILFDDIVSGRDELGVLLMGHDFKSWWTGSLLSIEETRALVPGQNATTLQVACSILGAIDWMIKNPQAGVLVPDQLPYQEILKVAKPYLGTWYSKPVDWSPLKNRNNLYKNYGAADIPVEDEWQFTTFLV